MIKILANDGLSQSGIEALISKGFKVTTEKVNQDNLINSINSENYEVLLVRSATSVRKDLIDACPHLKIIGRGGVGMDNIDVDYAKKKGIHVINTPAASSNAVAELVFAHLLNMVRFLFESNRRMPLVGDSEFKTLKKNFSKGTEIKNKTLGIIGFGRIGEEVAKKAIGLGMNILVYDKFLKEKDIELVFFNNEIKKFKIQTTKLNDVLIKSDFITIHVPMIENKAIIGANEIGLMKKGSGIINTSRGGLVDETALMFALDKEKISYAGLDVYVNEPKPSIHICMHNALSLTPHIGAATIEAQSRIGIELAEKISELLK